MEPIYKYLLEPLLSNTNLEIGESEELSMNLSLSDTIDSESLQKIIYIGARLRLQHGSEESRYFLDNPNWKFDNSINPMLFFMYYYLQTVIQHERYDVQELESCWEKLGDYFQRCELEGEIGKKWRLRFLLLRGMVGIMRNDAASLQNVIKDVIQKFDEQLLPNPWYNFAVYFGSWAREYEWYEEAAVLLQKALQLSQNAVQKAIAYCNLGALEFARDNWDKAKDYYISAKEVFYDNCLLEQDNEIRYLLREIEQNIMLIEINIQESKGKYEIMPHLPFFVESELSLAKKWENAAGEYISDELFDIKLAGRYSFRMSNNFYESIRYFNRSEAALIAMGNVVARKWLLKREVRAFLSAGKDAEDRRILQIALEQAVLVNERKAIEGLIGDIIPFKSNEELELFCGSLFKPTRNRLFMIGRLNCLSQLADYLPDHYILRALETAFYGLRREWSFTQDFDYKRPAIRALGSLLRRVLPDQCARILKEFWQEFKSGNSFVRNEIAEQLRAYPDWVHVEQILLQELSDGLLEYVRQSSEDEVWYSSLSHALGTMSEKLHPERQKKVALFFAEKVSNSTVSLGVLQHEWLARYLTQDHLNPIVRRLIEYMAAEMKDEGKPSYGMGKYFWGALLANYLAFLEGNLLKEARAALISYVAADNILPYKRAAALHNMGVVLAEHRERFDTLDEIQEICRKCLDCDYWKNARSNGKGFWARYEDINVLAVEAAHILFQLKSDDRLGLARNVIARSLEARGEGLRGCLIFLSRFARNITDRNVIFAEIFGRLLGEINNPDEEIRAVIAYWLPGVITRKKADSIYWPYVKRLINKFAEDESRLVRANLAYGLKEAVKFWPARYRLDMKKVINSLANDISFRVRQIAGQVEL